MEAIEGSPDFFLDDDDDDDRDGDDDDGEEEEEDDDDDRGEWRLKLSTEDLPPGNYIALVDDKSNQIAGFAVNFSLADDDDQEEDEEDDDDDDDDDDD